jgi:hypothetical protein
VFTTFDDETIVYILRLDEKRSIFQKKCWEMERREKESGGLYSKGGIINESTGSWTSPIWINAFDRRD